MSIRNIIAASGLGSSAPIGSTWTVRTSGTINDLVDVQWMPELSCFMACGSAGTIIKSTDGRTWTNVTSPNTGLALSGIMYADRIVTSSGRYIMSSTNGGTSWTTSDMGQFSGGQLYCVWNGVSNSTDSRLAFVNSYTQGSTNVRLYVVGLNSDLTTYTQTPGWTNTQITKFVSSGSPHYLDWNGYNFFVATANDGGFNANYSTDALGGSYLSGTAYSDGSVITPYESTYLDKNGGYVVNSSYTTYNAGLYIGRVFGDQSNSAVIAQSETIAFMSSRILSPKGYNSIILQAVDYDTGDSYFYQGFNGITSIRQVSTPSAIGTTMFNGCARSPAGVLVLVGPGGKIVTTE